MITARTRGLGWVAAGATALVLAAALAAGCSQQQWRDLEGLAITDPDRTRLVTNADGFPNVVALCINGAGFATTTREGYGAIQRVDEWDASNGGWCSEEAR